MLICSLGCIIMTIWIILQIIIGLLALLFGVCTWIDGAKTISKVLLGIGILCLVLAWHHTSTYTDPVKVCDRDGGVYGIYADGSYKRFGSYYVELLKNGENPVRYVRFDAGGGYKWNFTETSKDGYKFTITCGASWQKDEHGGVFEPEDVHRLMKTDGIDWPQKFLKPSEDYIRNGIKTHTYTEILEGNYWNLDYMLEYERKYSMSRYGFMIHMNEHTPTMELYQLQKQYFKQRDDGIVNELAASYGIDTEPEYDYVDYITPTPTPKTYNSYYKDGILYGEGLCNDGTCYDTHEELTQALINELKNNSNA